MLEVENLTKYYKSTKGIEDLNFTLKSGQSTGIIGINGSGKTTAFRVLLGLLKPDSATITFKGKDISTYDNSLFGYLPEERSLYKDLLVVDQVMLLGRLKGMDDITIINNLEHYLSMLKILKYKYTKIEKLSKGNQQKIQIICALIHDPQIIILDEPLSGLDIINVNLLKKLIYSLKRDGKYILMSSHQFIHIEQFCENIIILKHGDVMFNDSIKSLIDDFTYKYITLDKETSLKYMDRACIVNASEENDSVILKIDNKENAQLLMKEIVKDNDINNISIDDASIETIIQEMKLI